MFLPEQAPWLEAYLDELSAFPSGAHDDWVDATTQALNHLRPRGDSQVRIYDSTTERDITSLCARSEDQQCRWQLAQLR